MSKLPVLNVNSSGKGVRLLETRLKALGFDPGRINGEYDGDTVAAVKAFQRKRELDDDGEVGAETWAQIISEELNDASGTHPGALAKKLVEVANAQHHQFQGDSEADTVLCTQIKKFYSTNHLTFTSCTGQAWSGAFVSFCVRQAGTNGNDFTFSAAHSVFVHSAIRNADTKSGHWRGVPFNAVRLRVGDIVQNNREQPVRTFETARNRSNYHSHSAIIVEIDPDNQIAWSIGGNEHDAITQTKLRLTPAGRIKERSANPYIALLRNV